MSNEEFCKTAFDLGAHLGETNATIELCADTHRMIQHAVKLQKDNAELINTCESAEKEFWHYAETHRKKGTPEGNRKALENEILADEMRTAIAKAKEKPSGY